MRAQGNEVLLGERGRTRPAHAVAGILVGIAALLMLFVAVVGVSTLVERDGVAATILDAVVRVGALILLLAPAALRRPRAALAGVVALLGLAIAVHDRQIAWDRFVAAPGVPDDLAAFMRDAGTTYRDGGLTLLWFKLRQASAYSCVQGAGILFFRGTVLEYQRRTDALAVLNTGDFSPVPDLFCRTRNPIDAEGPRGGDDLVAACRAYPDLDTLVLVHRVPETDHLSWRPPVPFTRLIPGRPMTRHDTLYRYDCARPRAP